MVNANCELVGFKGLTASSRFVTRKRSAAAFARLSSKIQVRIVPSIGGKGFRYAAVA
jgi:hypothetical protein